MVQTPQFYLSAAAPVKFNAAADFFTADCLAK
jgi:hypothetical protein